MFGLCHNVSTNFVHSYKKEARRDGGGAKYKVMSYTLEQEPGIMKVLAQDRKASHHIARRIFMWMTRKMWDMALFCHVGSSNCRYRVHR